MKKSTAGLRVMVLYGWESNPYAESAIRALLARGVKVDLVARAGFDAMGAEPDCTVHPFFPGHRNGRSHVRMLLLEAAALVRTVRLVLQTRPDVVHYQSFRMIRIDWMLLVLLRLLGQKIVFTVHDTHSLEASSLDTFIFSRTARRADVLLVHNGASRDVLLEKWGIKPERVIVIPHGGYDHYYPRAASKSAARSRLGYSDELVLLAFGTVREYKGLDYLLPAIREMRGRIPALRLIIAGRAFDPALGERYKGQISELGLEDLVRFENRFIEDPEVETLFTASDLVVLPYIRIDQSGVLFLAYTFGRPVLATSVGGFPELVREGKSGYLVEAANTQALADGIVRAWTERERLPEMGANARRLVEDEYTWERQADLTLSAYAGLLDGVHHVPAPGLDSPASGRHAGHETGGTRPSSVP